MFYRNGDCRRKEMTLGEKEESEMNDIEDYSFYLAEMPKKLAELTKLLNGKEWDKSYTLSLSMARELQCVGNIAWVEYQKLEECQK